MAYDYIKLAKKSKLTEREMNALKNAINNSPQKRMILSATYQNKRMESGEGVTLTKEQVNKGAKYLYNLGFTPKGKERSNSPYGYRENEIVNKGGKGKNSIRTLKLLQWYSPRGNYYIPYYKAIGKNGDSMDYFVWLGKINIYG